MNPRNIHDKFWLSLVPFDLYVSHFMFFSNFVVIDGYSTAPVGSPHILPLSSPDIGGSLNHACPTRHARTERGCSRSFSKRSWFPEKTKTYTVTELESATNKYSEENLLGEGSLGSVYKAEFPDGQV